MGGRRVVEAPLDALVGVEEEELVAGTGAAEAEKHVPFRAVVADRPVRFDPAGAGSDCFFAGAVLGERAAASEGAMPGAVEADNLIAAGGEERLDGGADEGCFLEDGEGAEGQETCRRISSRWSLRRTSARIWNGPASYVSPR